MSLVPLSIGFGGGLVVAIGAAATWLRMRGRWGALHPERIVQACEHPTVLIDRDERLIAANDEAVRLLGRPRERLLGEPLAAFHEAHPVLGRVVRAESGGLTAISLMAAPVTTKGRQLVLLHHEVDREQRHAEVAAWRDRHARLFDALPCGVMRVDPAGRLVSINDAARRFLNLPLEAPLGALMLEEFLANSIRADGSALPPSESPALRVFATGEPQGPLVSGVRLADGSVRWSLSRTIPARALVMEPDSTDALILFTDVTELKKLERELASERRRYRVLFERNPLPSWIYDEGTLRFLDVNEAAIRHYGYTRDEFLGMTLFDLRLPEDHAKLREVVRLPRPERSPAAMWRHRKKDGTICFVNINSYSIGHAGLPARYVTAVDVTDEKRTREALEGSEDRHRRVVELTGQLVYDFNYVTGRIEWSGATVRVAGLPHETMQSVDLDEWERNLHPEDRERVMRDFHAMLASGDIFRAAYRYRRADGSYVDVSEIGHQLRDERGIAYRLIGTMQDVTEQKRNEERLRETSRRLIEAQRIAGVGSWDLNLHTGALAWSETVFHIFEIDPSRFSGTTEDFYRIVHPDDRESVHAGFEASVQSRQPYDITHRLLLPDGRVKHVHECAEVFYDEAGRPLRATGTVEDVTERVEREAALRESEHRQQLAINAAGLGLWEWDITTLKVAWAGEFERVFGFEPGTYPGRHEASLERVHPEDRSQVAEALQRAVDLNELFSLDFRILAADGTIRWVHSEGRMAPSEPGRPPRMVGVARDITERKLIELRQQLLMNELDHRVKNNLAAVATIAQQTMASSASLEEFGPAFMGRVVAMSRTHDALARSRWEGVNLREAAELVLATHFLSKTPRIEISGPSLRLPARAAMPVCLALHELATNAVKYGALSGERGRVLLRWRRDDDDWIELRWEEKGGPPVETPRRAGMGRQLIDGLICYELRGEVDLQFPPGGVVCIMRLRTSEAIESSSVVRPPQSAQAGHTITPSND